ncbi:MAG: hypothetical protein JNK29_16025 [Anaerolineales bacterium]|nr:hypothetical protein [Anaerolineales bacterium]
MTRPTSGNARPPLTWQQAATAIIMVAAVAMVVDFSQRLAASQRLVESANIAATEVAVLEREQTALQTQVAYATTDPAVIAWAHEQGMMVRPGEVLVVPILPTPAATARPPAAVAPAPLPNWSLWYAAFFERAP